ncbi:alpha/beta hydrolase [Paraburkholderia caffeinilytica]|uniref:alpha/beta hydrolase n=1 Tax=Paraburkholderia caffeinilytica TaxID=1761016 RepID=UPI0038BB9D26
MSHVSIPQDVWDALEQVGPTWASNVSAHVRQMVELFSPLLEKADKSGVNVTRDLPYGHHPRQHLDVFAPKDAAGLPVVLFVHGGAFVEGDRNRSPEIYSNVLHYFARHGCVGVNMEYRLAPESIFPAGAEDVSRAVGWVTENVTEYGGDPRAIFVIGHSAGAAHVASYVLDPRFEQPGEQSVRGLVVISGRVRADAEPRNPNAEKVQAYYGSDPASYEARSPVTYAGRARVPVFIAFAEYENPLIDVYCLELAYRIAKASGRAPEVVRINRHNHTSIVAHLNTDDDELGSRIRNFIRRHAPRPGV